MMRFNGTSWTPNFVSMTDLRSTITGTNQFATSCTSSQTLTYNSVGDVMSCQNISVAGSNFSSQTQNTFLAAPNGSAGAPAFRALASADLPSGIATAGTYRSVTVDTYGRVTAGTVPTTAAEYGITDSVLNGGQAGAVVVGTSDANALSFRTSGTTRMSVTSAGAVAVGAATTTPATFMVSGESPAAGVAPLSVNMVGGTGGSGAGATGGALTFRGGTGGVSGGAGGALTFMGGVANGGSSYTTFTIGGSSSSGGAFTMAGGHAGSGTGGAFLFTGGAGGGAGVGGGFTATAGPGGSNGVGGAVTLTAGAAGGGNNNGGSVAINPGAPTGTGANGSIALANLRGYVGIGTASPVGILDVRGGTAAIGAGSNSINIIAQAAAQSGGYTTATNGGSINLTAGNSYSGGGAGNVTIRAGQNGVGASGGGSLILNGGSVYNPGTVELSSGQGSSGWAHGGVFTIGTATINGGPISLVGGAASSSNANGGNVLLDGGAPHGTGSAGYVLLGSVRGNVGVGTASPGAKLDIAGQFRTSGTTPTISACGTTPGISGTNQAGLITMGSGALTSCTISFQATLTNAPHSCVLFPGNAAAAATGTTGAYISSISTAGFVVTGTNLTSASYWFHCY